MIALLSAAAVAAALRAATAQAVRGAVSALWLCALLVGAIFLLLGFEYLAIALWIASTLSCLGFVFFAALVGNDLPTEPSGGRAVFAAVVGASFGAFMAAGVFEEWTREALLGDLLRVPEATVREFGPALLDHDGAAVLFFSLAVCFIGTMAATLGRTGK